MLAVNAADVQTIAGTHGFESIGVCAANGLEPLPEVRAMCSADLCRAYGHSWSCPPACAPIETYGALMHSFETCVVVQSVGQMEDPFDFEAIEETNQVHTGRFLALVQQLREDGLAFMPLGAGTCTLCTNCTYPDAPCRFPDQQLVSMEAAGLMVTDVCTQAGIPYNHGENTIAFSSCVLL